MTKLRERDEDGDLAFASDEGPKRVQIFGGTTASPPASALCECGRPLHYENAGLRDRMERLVAQLGKTVDVVVPGHGTWKVPRHYIALHGIKAMEVPALAEHKGWEKVG